ncbi:MAG: EAL domain-containing protein [Kordiimonadaceae bacterium]|nr:EAL domain-containing protein [Kordiimonadaceae bacterium]
MTIPPRLFGLDAQVSGYLGMLVFFGGWQLQNWIMNNRANSDAASRLEHLEDVTHILRKDLERARREVASRGREGEEANEHLVGELKLLQTLLSQVNTKELELKGGSSEGGTAEITEADALELSADHGPRDTGSDAAADGDLEFTPDPAEQITEADIEELGLTAEEAALVVMESDEAPAAASSPDPQPSKKQGADAAPAPRSKASPRRAPAAKRKAPIRIIKREDQLLKVVKSSLSENRVDLYLQPIVNLPARRTMHFECFSRVRDEAGSVICHGNI